MRILAIDSSGLVATVAVVEEKRNFQTIAEYTINYQKDTFTDLITDVG